METITPDNGNGEKKEGLSGSRRLVYIPLAQIEGHGFFPEAAPHFDRSLLEKNLNHLQQIDSNSISDGASREYFVKSRKRLVEDYKFFSHRLEELSHSPDIAFSLSSQISNYEAVKPGSSLSEAIGNLSVRLWGEGNIIIGSDSHLATYTALEALKVHNVGLIVFDTHTDFYWTWSDKLAEVDPVPKHPQKPNFLRYLLEDSRVGAVSIWGPSEYLIKELRSGKMDQNLFEPTAEIYGKFRDRILLVSQEETLSAKSRLIPSVVEQINNFKRHGITQMVFSVDVDVLRARELGYTAMEYNPMSAIVLLGLQDLTWAEEEGVKLNPDDPIKATQFRNQKLLEALGQLILPTKEATPAALNARRPQSLRDSGLALATIGKVVDMTKAVGLSNGIETGISLDGGGKLLGDISEMAGVDYKSRVARAAKSLMSKF